MASKKLSAEQTAAIKTLMTCELLTLQAITAALVEQCNMVQAQKWESPRGAALASQARDQILRSLGL